MKIFTQPYMIPGFIMAFSEEDMNEDSFLGLYASAEEAELRNA